MSFSAILVAAGSGRRNGGSLPKQWQDLGGRPVVRWSLEALLGFGCDEVVVVVSEDDFHRTESTFEGLKGWHAVIGGAERSQSVAKGLAALTHSNPIIFVHDAARPFLRHEHLSRLAKALENLDNDVAGAVLARPLSDTLKRGEDGLVQATLSRENLYSIQTPQAFSLAWLKKAYEHFEPLATDDASLVEAIGGRIKLVPGDPLLMKLTYPQDFDMARQLLAQTSPMTRIGQGFDAHRFGEASGSGLWLCGVHIPHGRSLIGHSDADVGLHALTDAILGAMALGDIGEHFPPHDPQWKGASSTLFLNHAHDLIKALGARIRQVDVTLICEHPKISPYRLTMRQYLSESLSLPLDRISLKATTTEGMGFTGRGEGIAAQAIANLEI